MAEINQFGKGIALNCGFDLGAQQLLDSRSIVADRTELEAIPNIRRANGLLVWIQDEKKLVAWDEPNSAWVEVSGDTSNIEQIASDLEALELRVNANGDTIYDLKTQISEIEVDDTFYSDKSYALTRAHGGLASGTDVAGWKIKDILKKILFPLRVPTVTLTGPKNGLVTQLFSGDNYNFNMKVSEGDFPMHNYGRIIRNGTEFFSGNIEAKFEADELDVSLFAKTTFQVMLQTAVDEETADSDALKYYDTEIASNILTTYAVRPLYYAWSKIEAPTFPDDCAEYFSSGQRSLFTAPPQRMLTKEKEVTLNFFANEEAARMIILSPYKISKILNPSAFDITSSFTETSGSLGIRTLPVGWSDDKQTAYCLNKLYLYVSNITSQEKAYPLTVTFE